MPSRRRKDAIHHAFAIYWRRDSFSRVITFMSVDHLVMAVNLGIRLLGPEAFQGMLITAVALDTLPD